MEMLLRDRGVWEIVEGTEIAPFGDSEQLRKYKHRQSKAYSTIALGLSKDTRSIIEGVTTAKEIWTVLKDAYEPKSRSRIASLRKEFYSLRFQEGETMHAFIGRLNHVKNQLADSGKIVEDDEVAYQLIGSLPASYESLVLQIYQAADKDFKPEIIKKQLIAEYGRQVLKRQDEEGQLVKEALLVRHLKKDPARSFTKTEPMVMGTFKGKCFNCGKYGHRAATCRLSKQASNVPRKDKKPAMSDATGRTSAFLATPACSMVALEEDEWFIDTAATHHFCNRREWFSTFTKSSDLDVEIGEGESIAKGTGDIWIRLNVQGEVHEFRMMNVIYAPKLRRNLISGRLLDQAGFMGSLKNSKITIYYPNGVLAFEAPLQKNNFYTVSPQIIHKESNRREAEISSVDVKREVQVWHERLGHVNETDLKFMANHHLCLGLDPLRGNLDTCLPCKLSKAARQPYKGLEQIRSTKVLELVHSDLWGPAPVVSLGGARYYISFIDDYSRMVTIFTIPEKSMAFNCFKSYQARVERQTGEKIKALRTDNGMEFCANYFTEYLEKVGIRHERTNTYSPQMNGVAERVNRSLLETTRTLLTDAKLPPQMWAEMANTSAYLKNRVKHSAINNEVPLTRWMKRQPSVRHLKRIGCLAFAYQPKYKRNKLQHRAALGVLVGYAINTKGYRIWYPEEQKVVETKHVSFDEKQIGVDCSEATYVQDVNTLKWTDADEDSESEPEEPTVPVPDYQPRVSPESQRRDHLIEARVQTSLPVGWRRELVQRKTGISKGRADVYYYTPDGVRLRSMNDVVAYQQDGDLNLDLNLFNFSGRPSVKPCVNPSKGDSQTAENEVYAANCTELRIPKNYQEAMQSEQRNEWQKAMKEELHMFKKRDVADVIPIPKGQKIIGSRWVFTVKREHGGDIVKHKARLVAQGFNQAEGVDYDETFSPVVNFTLIRLFFLVFVLMMGWVHCHLDVTCAYLYGNLDHEIYMRQAPGCEEKDPNEYCLKLKKAIYGLPQAGRQWYNELDSTFSELGFKKLPGTNCVYYIPFKAIILVYVDDFAVLAHSKDVMQGVFDLISTRFQLKDLGPIKHFLGVEFEQLTTGETRLHQTPYIEKLAQKFDIRVEEPVSLPLSAGAILTRKDCPTCDEERNKMMHVPYRSLVGSLLFIAQRTRPDIMYAVAALSQFNNDPGFVHWNLLLQLARYVISTKNYGLLYSHEMSPKLVVYSDSDWGSDRDTRRSTGGYVLMVGAYPFVWRTFKQTSVSLSTMEAEFVALAESVKELMWVLRILNECEVFGVFVPQPVIYCDNQSAIMFGNNTIENNRSKHIDIKYHFVREKLKEELFVLKFVRSKENIADIFTKALTKEQFHFLVTLLMLK